MTAPEPPVTKYRGAMHDALAGSEADTSDTQPTDQEVSDE